MPSRLHTEPNIAVVQRRWPEVWARVRQAPRLRHWHRPTDTPEPTLVINGLHLTSGFARLAEDSSARLRDLIVLELATPFIRKRHAHRIDWSERLRGTLPFVASDGDVAALFSTTPHALVIVAGSGSSLHQGLIVDSEPPRSGGPHRDSYCLSSPP